MITDRIDAITRIEDNYRGTVLPAPRSVKVEITSRCNYSCAFCAKSVHNAPARDMDAALYSRILREMREAGVEELGVFYIGESFTCHWLPEAIREAKECGFPYVFLTTNGAATTRTRLQAVMEAGLDSLKFSLNFATPEQLRKVAHVSEEAWRRAIDAVKLAREIRDAGQYPCGIYASSIRLDGTQQEAMQTVVDEILPHVDEHYWLPLYGMSGAAMAAGMQPMPGNPGRLDAMRPPIPCWSVFTEGHVTVDGLLSACCFGNGASDSLAMADLRQVDFMTGWNSARYQVLRAQHLTGDVSASACSECMT